MQSILSKVKLGTQTGGGPPVAVELAPEGVLAAALPAKGQAPVYAFEPLKPGALVPGIGEPNVRAAEAVANAIRSALGQVSPRTRAVTMVLPDTVVRVFVLDFDSLPGKPAEAFPVLRFRLRKMVPFDVEHAAVSYQVLTESKSELKVLAAVIPNAILQEYEAAVRAAGYEPGTILPSSLAALAGIDSLEAVLTANLSGLALTTSITNGNASRGSTSRDADCVGERFRERVVHGHGHRSMAFHFVSRRLSSRPIDRYRQSQGTGGRHVPRQRGDQSGHAHTEHFGYVNRIREPGAHHYSRRVHF